MTDAELAVKNDLKPGDKVVDLRSKVKVYATKAYGPAAGTNHKEGEEIECHPHLAEHFVKKGYATEKKK